MTKYDEYENRLNKLRKLEQNERMKLYVTTHNKLLALGDCKMKKYPLYLLFAFVFSTISQNVFADGANCPSIEMMKMQNTGSVSEYARVNNVILYEARGASFKDSNHTWRILYQFETTSSVNGLSRANEIKDNIDSGYTTTNRQDEVNEWYCMYHSSADPRALIMASYSF